MKDHLTPPKRSINRTTPFFNKGQHPTFFQKKAEEHFFSTSPQVQTKLTIGQPGDKYEQEADAMADQVVNRSGTPNVQEQCAACGKDEGAVLPKLQRMEGEEEEMQMKPEIQKMGEEEEEMQMKSEGGNSSQATPTLSNQIEQSKGGGNALYRGTQAEMESAFGADFSNVRIHTGQESVQMNQSLNAQAFTHGNNVYFNEGKYNPDTSSGKHLLAHELTHVVQQGADGK